MLLYAGLFKSATQDGQGQLRGPGFGGQIALGGDDLLIVPHAGLLC